MWGSEGLGSTFRGLLRFGGEGFTYAKWEAFSSTLADRRFFMAAALSMVMADVSV